MFYKSIFTVAGIAATAGLMLFTGCKEDPVTPSGGYTLNVVIAPSGGGTVSYDASTPKKAEYDADETVILTASENDGYTFSGWLGAVESPNKTVTVTMNGNKSLTALFTAEGSVVEPPVFGTPNTLWFTSNQTAATYTITTADELAGLAELVNAGNKFASKTIVLGNDIDVSHYGALNNSFNNGRGWIPIGLYANSNVNPFSGTFDGKGYEISGLYINNTSQHYVGLFGNVDGGDLKDVGVVDVDVSGGSNTGGLVGHLNVGSIENCYSTGSVKGSNPTGGLAGLVEGTASIVTSYSTAIVRGGGTTGGLVGRLISGTISNCYALGSVNGGSRVGGMVGESAGGITNSYAAGAVSGSEMVGGVVGYATGSWSLINCAGLNSDIQAPSSYGRVIGTPNGSNASSNAGYVGMTRNGSAAEWDISTASAMQRNGHTDLTLSAILEDPTIGNRFRDANGWTVEAGKLPGLLGESVDMPSHLSE